MCVCTHTQTCIQTEDFRFAFSQIGDLHSIITENVHTLALTRTATLEVYDSIVKRLSLRDPAVIGLSPYHVEPLLSVQHHRNVF